MTSIRYPRPIPEFDPDERAFVLGLIGSRESNGCMPWRGAPFNTYGCDPGLSQKSHGRVSLRRRQWQAHRIVYTLLRGPIPEEFSIDHLCGFAGCVNPDHLEPVEPAENSRRETPRNRRRMMDRAIALGVEPRELIEPDSCWERDTIIDEVISCDLPDGHDGPHHTTMVDDNTWRKVRTTWEIRWQYEDLPQPRELIEPER